MRGPRDPVLTDLDSRATVLSIDGISAFDMISRAAMLDGLHPVRGGDTALPFVLQFYSEPSQYFWTDESGHTHVVHQGEGGEQGDALMPMLYALGQHRALLCLQDFLLPHEHLFAYLDDLYVVCLPDRVGPIFKHLQEALDQYARIQVHLGKTQVWNRGGHVPPGCQEMQEVAALTHWPESGEVRDHHRSKGSGCWASQLATKSLSRLSFGPPPKSTDF